MFGLLERDITNIREAVDTFPEISTVIIFGSRALGNYKKWSDVDIAVKGADITHETAARLSGILNEEKPLPYFFDVIDYNSLPDNDLKKHIDTCGKIFI